jgi:FixJ family two-component response regulator
MTMDPILLVDDEEDLRILLRDALRLDGFQVEDAPDALSALALMDTRHFPVILTDLNMPGGPTGFEFIQAVKARDPLTLCVVITGYASLESAIQAVKYGAYDFVQKPFKLGEIEAVLSRALDHATVVGQLADYQKDLEGRVLARVQELRDYQAEVLRLNDLLVASQDELEELPLLQPFLDHFCLRFSPLGHTVLLPTAADAWTVALHASARPWSGEALPPPSALKAAEDWGCQKDLTEGTLIPLRRGELILGALHVAFPWRHSFNLEDQAFVFWRRQVEAALHGLARTRAHVARLQSTHIP